MADVDNQAARCPACGALAMVRILYGRPSRQGFEAAERGEVVLGGCVVSRESPLFACTACHARFGDHEDLYRQRFPDQHPGERTKDKPTSETTSEAEG